MVRNQCPFRIDAWVLLLDHLHTILTLPPGDARFALRWQQNKRLVTLRCGERLHQVDWMTESKTKHRESTLWQRRYWEHQIRDEADLERHMDYVHFNPVKHGLVKQVSDWPYSSFHRHVEAGMYGENWAIASAIDKTGFGDVA